MILYCAFFSGAFLSMYIFRDGEHWLSLLTSIVYFIVAYIYYKSLKEEINYWKKHTSWAMDLLEKVTKK